MSLFGQDVQFGSRLLTRNPLFTVIVAATLAVGIGLNTTVFSVVNSLLLRPLGYQDPGRLVAIWPERLLSKEHLAFFRGQARSFSDVAAFVNGDTFTLTGAGEPEELPGAQVSANYFQVLGTRAAMGRTFLTREDQAGAAPIVVLGNSLWRRRFGGSPDIINLTVRLNGLPYTVVGVMGADFHPLQHGTELWVPTRLDPAADDYKERECTFLGRLRPGTDLRQAQVETATIAERMRQHFSYSAHFAEGATAVPLQDWMVGKMRPRLLLLLGAVLLVLLIACVNVANLLLVRATARRKEYAIRAALGADRRRLVRQAVTEFMLFALLGGGLGLLAAIWGIRVLVGSLPANTPRLAEIGIDGAVLAFSLILSLLTGAIVGLVPALRSSSRLNLQQSLSGAGRSSATGGALRMRRMLVVTEIAVAAVLVIGTGLLAKSLWRLFRVDPGFSTNQVLTCTIPLPESRYPDAARQTAFFHELLDRVQALPGAERAGIIQHLPLGSFPWMAALEIQGRPQPPQDRPLVTWRLISPRYLETLQIPVERGRGFLPSDRSGSAQVALVNHAMASKLWPKDDPIGKEVKAGFATGPGWVTIVGVVGDVKHENLEAGDTPALYRPFDQLPLGRMSLVVRTRTDPESLSQALRETVYAIGKDVPVADMRTMNQVVSESVSEPKLITLLLVIFAALAVLLGAIGIYGVMAYSVSQRAHEIAVRMAIGAQRGSVQWMILSDGLLLAVIGAALGALGGLWLTRFLGSLLFEVTATDPAIFVIASLLLISVALLACYVPAVRASRTAPLRVLREP